MPNAQALLRGNFSTLGIGHWALMSYRTVGVPALEVYTQSDLIPVLHVALCILHFAFCIQNAILPDRTVGR